MLKSYPYISLFCVAMFSNPRVAGQMTMPDNVCTGQLKHYNVDNNPGSNYIWLIDGVVQDGFNTNEFVHTWNTQNTYLLEVQEFSADGCPGPVRSGQVFVNPLPAVVAYVIDSFTPGDNGNIHFSFSNVPDGVYTISFATGSFDNVIVAGGIATVTAPPGIYNNISITVSGCTSLSTKVVMWDFQQSGLIIPEAFSPNGDLVNDVWEIGNIEAYPKAVITIYNRWGQSVWRSDLGYSHPWDGKSNDVNLPIDTYHYLIELHNGSKPIVGGITIVR